MSDDGGVVIDLDPMASSRMGSGDFSANLAEELSDQDLGSISSELMSEYQGNKSSRKDWEDAYSKGLELLGFTYEDRTQPFRGATGVTHPLLAEAATQFQAQAFNELLPPGGPVRTTIMGDVTSEKEQQARRVKEFMNYYITNVMEDYTPEFDQMLFYLPLAGSTFKKVYYDETMERAVSSFVPAEHLVVPYEASDFQTLRKFFDYHLMNCVKNNYLGFTETCQSILLNPTVTAFLAKLNLLMDYIRRILTMIAHYWNVMWTWICRVSKKLVKMVNRQV